MGNNYIGSWTVLRRELRRFFSIKKQTIFGPLLETYLYISVFGAALGSRINEIEGVSYIVFIIPGLLLMSMSINAFSNNSSSLIQQKFGKSIEDQLTAPVSNGALMWAFTLGGLIRGAIIATITFLTAALLIDLPLAHPFILVASMLICGTFFAALGVLIGLRAETFDSISFYQTFILQPLIFLGGIFYSVALLPEPFKTLSQFNPIYYMINTVRYGMIGTSEVKPYLSLVIITLATATLVFINLRLFQKGYKLRS